jgi:uncharacterized membrane protein YadS
MYLVRAPSRDKGADQKMLGERPAILRFGIMTYGSGIEFNEIIQTAVS